MSCFISLTCPLMLQSFGLEAWTVHKPIQPRVEIQPYLDEWGWQGLNSDK